MELQSSKNRRRIVDATRLAQKVNKAGGHGGPPLRIRRGNFELQTVRRAALRGRPLVLVEAEWASTTS